MSPAMGVDHGEVRASPAMGVDRGRFFQTTGDGVRGWHCFELSKKKINI